MAKRKELREEYEEENYEDGKSYSKSQVFCFNLYSSGVPYLGGLYCSDAFRC